MNALVRTLQIWTPAITDCRVNLRYLPEPQIDHSLIAARTALLGISILVGHSLTRSVMTPWKWVAYFLSPLVFFLFERVQANEAYHERAIFSYLTEFAVPGWVPRHFIHDVKATQDLLKRVPLSAIEKVTQENHTLLASLIDQKIPESLDTFNALMLAGLPIPSQKLIRALEIGWEWSALNNPAVMPDKYTNKEHAQIWQAVTTPYQAEKLVQKGFKPIAEDVLAALERYFKKHMSRDLNPHFPNDFPYDLFPIINLLRVGAPLPPLDSKIKLNIGDQTTEWTLQNLLEEDKRLNWVFNSAQIHSASRPSDPIPYFPQEEINFFSFWRPAVEIRAYGAFTVLYEALKVRAFMMASTLVIAVTRFYPSLRFRKYVLIFAAVFSLYYSWEKKRAVHYLTELARNHFRNLFPESRLVGFRVMHDTDFKPDASTLLQLNADGSSFWEIICYDTSCKGSITLERFKALASTAFADAQNKMLFLKGVIQGQRMEFIRHVLDQHVDLKTLTEVQQHICLAAAPTPEILEMLVNAGCNVDAKNEKGFSLLLSAVSSYGEMLPYARVLTLLHLKADPTLKVTVNGVQQGILDLIIRRAEPTRALLQAALTKRAPPIEAV